VNGKFGSFSWLDRTGGKLAWHNRLTMIAQGVQAKVARKKNIDIGFKVRNIEVADILPPDSAITREASAMCEDVSAPFLFNHCLRAYFWARLLDDGNKPFDDEALFASIMLHDLGLTDNYRLKGDTEHCFTVVGARIMETMALKHRWSDKRAAIAANAIALHINISVGNKHSREAQLLRIGSGCDVAGLGIEVLAQDQVDAVVKKHPRLGLKKKIALPLEIEVNERPCCRMAFMHNKLGFGCLIQGAPFAE